MLIRLVLFLFLLTGCVSQTAYWGGWSEWSEPNTTSKSEVRTLRITSEPANSKVYIDGRFEGVTPLTVSLSYPVIESERKRNKYQMTRSNWSPGWIIFRRGDRPGSREIIDSEKEAQNSLKNIRHRIAVKREGYRTAYKFLSHDDSYAHLILKEKLCLFFNNIRVEDESSLSVTQKIYDTLFKKKYKKDVKPEDLQNILESNEHFKEIFNLSRKKEDCNALNCKLTIHNDYTDLGITILDGKGNEVAESSSRFETSFERDDFLSNLRREIDKESYKIYRTLCGE